MSGSAPTHRLRDGGRRLKALRALLGISTPGAAAQTLGFPITANRWKEIETPNMPKWLELWEAEKIAEAVGMPVSFFYAPIEHLGDIREAA